jgi:hypothetical protein
VPIAKSQNNIFSVLRDIEAALRPSDEFLAERVVADVLVVVANTQQMAGEGACVSPAESGAIARRYGRLAVIGYRDARLAKVAICRCDCQNLVERSVEALVSGEMLNCGNCPATPATPDARSDTFASSVADLEGRSAWRRHKGGGGG